MKLRVHPKEWGPLQRGAAFVAAAAVLGLGIWLVDSLWPRPCGEDLKEVGGECVGVTDRAFYVEDPEVRKLLKAIEVQNNKVRDEHRSYVRVALTMPFTYADKSSRNNTSAMTKEMIRHALAGTLVAQRRVNSDENRVHLQVLPAPVGKNLDKWSTVRHRLYEEIKNEEEPENEKTPLVGVTGIPSSTYKTQEAVSDLSKLRIPTIGPLVSSTDMKADTKEDYFFKTSPNNEEFVKALRKYLDRSPDAKEQHAKRGILVYDKEEDAYAKDLREVMEAEFDRDWGLREINYSGITARGKGLPQRFGPAAGAICNGEYDTVFFSGRDQDLPEFITELDENSQCDDKSGKLRILKVGTGFDPSLTGGDSLAHLTKTARITLVDASSVDTGWWDPERGDVPSGVESFRSKFKELQLEKSYELGAKPLDDGYAAMSHDGLWALTEAVERSYDDIRKKAPESGKMPSKDVVYDTLQNFFIDESSCLGCLKGAGGTYGLGNSKTEQWSVCKPVPVLKLGPDTEYKPESVGPLYRTYQDTINKDCPRDSGLEDPEPED